MARETTSRRRVIRFGLRTLLFLTLIAALPFGWIAQKRSEWASEQNSINAISEHVSYFGRSAYLAPHWLYRLGFRPDFLFRVTEINITTGEPGKVERIGDPPNPYRELTDLTLAKIAPEIQNFKYLSQLEIAETKISDASYSVITRFSNVDFINLQGNKMSDEMISELESSMPNTDFCFKYSVDEQMNKLFGQIKRQTNPDEFDAEPTE